MDSTGLLYRLQEQGIWLWRNADGQLGYSADDKERFTPSIRQEILANKAALLSMLSLNGIDSEARSRQQTVFRIPEAEGAHGLQAIQKGIALQSLLESTKAMYTVGLFVVVRNADAQCLKRAVEHLLARHRILRMRLDAEFNREFLPPQAITIHESTVTAEETDALIEARGRMAFEIQGCALIYPEIIRIKDSRDCIVNLTHHHVLSDALSCQLLTGHLIELYEAVLEDRAVTKPSGPDYIDYTHYIRHVLQTLDYREALPALARRLADAEPLSLGADCGTPGDTLAGMHAFSLEKSVCEKLSLLAQEHELSLYALLLTSLYRVLSVYAGGECRFPMGITVSNRLAEMVNVVGPFINTLPLIPDFEPTESFLQNAAKIHAEISFLNEFHQMNLNEIAECMPHNRENVAELMHILFTFHNFKTPTRLSHAVNHERLLLKDRFEKFGISFVAREEDGQIAFDVTWKMSRYSSALVESLCKSFITLTRKLAHGAFEASVNTVDLLDDALRHAILETYNRTEKAFPSHQTIHGMFEAQAKRTPDALAIIAGDVHLSYAELNARANQLARMLALHFKAASNPMVCVCLERSEHMLIALLAVLKAGGAYVPVTPDLPPARIQFIVSETESPLILTTQSCRNALESLSPEAVIAIDAPEFLASLSRFSAEDLPPVAPTALAYVIYTSGTTGQPKGVMLEHRGIINRIVWMNNLWPLTPEDRILQKTPFVFDVSVWELFWAHWYGACVVFAKPDGHKDPLFLQELMVRERVTIVHFVPSMLSAFLEALQPQDKTPVPTLKRMFCSGEALKMSHVHGVHQLFPHTQLINLYGPTEASVDVLYADCSSPALTEVVIGKPIDNTSAFVLDEGMNPLPSLAVGELYIGGIGLARGYLRRDELTASRFVPNPFGACPGSEHQRLYRTGDRVTLLPDGNIRYLGRNDFQVKIRGHRIETGEIEQQLLLCPGVKESVVVVKAHAGEPCLVGYYVSDAALEEEMLRAFLQERLPEYMVPVRLMHLAELPLTSNGKLDRKGLPEAVFSGACDTFEAPRSGLEAALHAIWCEVLGCDPGVTGVHEDFFRLGGDSITSIRLVSRLRQRLQCSLGVKDLFTHRSIRQLHDWLARLPQAPEGFEALRAEQGVLQGEVQLLPIQSWFFSRNFDNPHYWNQAFWLKTPAWSAKQLRDALQALSQHHDALRLRYRYEGDRVVQYYAKEVEIVLHELDMHDCDEARLSLLQSQFHLEIGPLWCVALVQDAKSGGSRVFFAFHHLLMDTVSWRILAEDLQALYEGRTLGPKGSSYRQWVEALTRFGNEHHAARGYWQNVMADMRTERWPGFAPGHARAETRFDAVETAYVLQDANRPFHTGIQDLLLTAFVQALARISGETVHHLTLEGHGREAIDASVDTIRTVGWFTSMFPVRLESGEDLAEDIRRVKAHLRGLPYHGLGYGAVMGAEDATLPPVCFNYLGQFTGESEWSIVIDGAGWLSDPVNKPAFSLEALAWVAEGQLGFSVRTPWDPVHAKALVEAFREALEEVIACCRSRGHTVEYSPDDFKEVESEASLASLPLHPAPHPDDWFPMTDIQKAYLLGRFGDYEIGNVANHVYSEFFFNTLQTDRLESVIRTLIAEYPVLRTVFSPETLEQRFLRLEETPVFSLAVHDRSHEPYHEAALAEVRERMSHMVYDVTAFPLFAFEVTRFADKVVLHVSSDLILLDVKSRHAFFAEISMRYREASRSPSPMPTVTFRDYQKYVALLRYSAWFRRDSQYWQEKIPEMPSRPRLPFRQAPDTILQPKFVEHTLYVDAQTWSAFCERASAHNLSHASVLLALYGKVIGFFSDNSDFLITLTLFNRYAIHPQVDNLWGDFTSTILFHYADCGARLCDTLTRTHARMWEDVHHALYSGIEVQRDLVKWHGFDVREAVSPIVFTGVLGNRSHRFDSEPFLEPDECMEQRYWCGQTSQAWIDLQAVETGSRFMSKWMYVEQLFEPGFIATLNQMYCALIQWFANNDWHLMPDLYSLLPPSHHAVVESANAAVMPMSELTLPGLCARYCEDAAYAERTAVIDAGLGRSFSWRELGADSHRMAVRLHALGKRKGLVGILSEKGYLQVVTTLGVMQSGHAYLPLHVEWPVGRLQDVLIQGGVETVVVSSRMARDAAKMEGLRSRWEVLVCEDLLSEPLLETALPVVSADDVAYVIFTSGSTGKPKGVTISHRGAVNTILAVNQAFGAGSDDRVLALSELSFDLSVYDLFGVLGAGGAVVFPRQEETKEPKHWLSLIREHGVTLWNTVPQLASLLVEEAEAGLSGIRAFLLSGDWIPVSLPARLKACSPDARVMSLGGATEGSIWSIWYPVDTVPASWTSIPYGVAMPNQKMYVLNRAGGHCPTGVMGEIHIGGVGVALNYWGDQAATERQFYEHPELGRLYRTGDCGRWHPDGYMEFCGRTDFQVKIRGHRIETGEIEQQLLLCPGVKESVVVVKAHAGEPCLVGYYVSDAALEEEMLRAFLQERLPEYMVPVRLMHLAELPLTSNGKLDRKGLPEPVFSGDCDTFEAPRAGLEAALHAIWCEVLGCDPGVTGVHEDFFRLGGDSITSIRLVSRLRQRLQCSLGVKDLFTHRSIRQLHDWLARLPQVPEGSEALRAEQGILEGEVQLLPIQSWFFSRNFDNPHYWNQAFWLKTPAWSAKQLRDALQALSQHHDALRLRYRYEGDRVVQYYAKEVEIVLHELDMHDCDEARLSLLQSQFHLENGPLWCVVLVQDAKSGGSRVFFAFHHLLMDTVSWRILAEDLQALYEGRTPGPKGSSYRQWVEAVRASGDADASFWSDITADWRPESMAEFERGIGSATFSLNPERTAALLDEANRFLQSSVHELLIAAFVQALETMNHHPVQHLMLEGHGREAVDASLDIAKTAGWFTTLYPVRLEVSHDLRICVQTVKETLRRIPQNGLGFGAFFVNNPQPLPGICFNYLGKVSGNPVRASDWAIIDEPVGLTVDAKNEEPWRINCYGGIHDDSLVMHCRTGFTQAFAHRLMERFQHNLEAIIDNFSAQPRTFLTRWDVHDVISTTCLERLQANHALQGVWLANSLQQGFMVHNMRQGAHDRAYRMQIIWRYDVPVDAAVLEDAWRCAMRRYPALRLRFVVDEELLQVLDAKGHMSWHYVDVSDCPTPMKRALIIDSLAEADMDKPFNLTAGNLWRLTLIRQHDTCHTCIFNAHHVILDGWSGPLLLSYVHEVYLRLLRGKAVSDPEDTAWMRTQEQLQALQADNHAWWTAQVAQIENPASLSFLLADDRRHIDINSWREMLRQETVEADLRSERFSRLRQMSMEHGLTANAVVLYAWHKVLAIYGMSDETVTGTIVSGRNLPVEGIEQSVGLYINTLPMRVCHRAHQSLTVLEACRETMDTIQEINAHAAVKLATIQPHGKRLFDCLYMYGNYPQLDGDGGGERLPFVIEKTVEQRDYPMSLSVDEEKDALRMVLAYDAQLFEQSMMEQVLGTLSWLIEQIIDNPSMPVSRLRYTREVPVDNTPKMAACGTFLDWFEARASAFSDHSAVKHGEHSLSYGELNATSNQLARVLMEKWPALYGARIAVCLKPGIDLITAILAVMKCGAAWVPLDPGYPAQRIRNILEHCEAVGVISRTSLEIDHPQAVLLDDDLTANAMAAASCANPGMVVSAGDLAYVIHTSGTTGKPKGVMIEHGAFMETLLAVRDAYFEGQHALSTYSTTNPVFDIFGLEYGLPLISGGCVEIGDKLFERLDCRRYDFIQMTPGVYELKQDNLQHTEQCALVLGGEAVRPALLERALARFSRVVHVYGPTETTIWSLAREYRHSAPLTVSLGTPLRHESAFVLDSQLTPLPPGAPGELYIGGTCLARGYINEPALTARQFIAHPWKSGARLYKTGDMVQQTASGEYIFLGRNDAQIKVRGYRIEPAGIEAVIEQYPGISRAVVRLHDDSLVAWYKADGYPDARDIQDFVRAQLPDYMVPQQCVRVDDFKLNLNGKLDITSLPAPGMHRRAHFVAPRNALEAHLAELWSDITGISPVSVEDNFFDMGGNSMVLVKLFSRLPEPLKSEVGLTDLFRLSTVAALARAGAHPQPCEVQADASAQATEKDNAIAIIGMAGRFPGAESIDAFWDNLQAGREAITRYSLEELADAGIDPALLADPY